MLQIGAGIGAVVLIGGFFYFLNVADRTVPVREEVRVTLPNAFAPEAPATPAEEPAR
jgi:hypothetical protein